jgi:hypothetical protein
VEDRSLCCEPQLPGELLLAASLDLQTLDNIGRREPRLLDQAQADMLLVLELKDGSQLIWPQSALRGEPLALAELPKPELGSDDLVYAPPPTFPLLPRCRGFLLLQLSEDFLLDLPPPPFHPFPSAYPTSTSLQYDVSAFGGREQNHPVLAF